VSLGEQQVRHVAQLARLGLTDDEVATFSEQLAEILDYAEQIGEVATGDVPPTAHPMRPVNVMREDEPVDGLAHREALAPAPRVADGRFQVPRISGEEPAALAPEGGDGSGEEPSEGARP
jgi:aspartyl-tRNA(Asn)/glutamyl-tRNA(Gln) amidotransferase subunit C